MLSEAYTLHSQETLIIQKIYKYPDLHLCYAVHQEYDERSNSYESFTKFHATLDRSDSSNVFSAATRGLYGS